MLEKMYRLLKGPAHVAPGSVFSFHRNAFLESTFLVRFFYFFAFYRVFGFINTNARFWLNAEAIDVLWPLAWFPLFPSLQSAIYLVLLSAIGLSILILIFPEKRVIRILFAIAFFQLAALINSFGKINHGLHAMVLTNFLFILLPKENWATVAKSITKRQTFLAIIWSAQALLLLYYTMSGLYKLYAVGYQLQHGQMSALHPHALAYQTVFRMLQTNEESLLGPLFIHNPVLGWPFYLAALYIETFSIVAAFRPRIHRFWGFSIMMFHLGTWLIMSVAFFEHMLLLGLLLMYSPFRPKHQTWMEFIGALPVIGDLFRWYLKRSRSGGALEPTTDRA